MSRLQNIWHSCNYILSIAETRLAISHFCVNTLHLDDLAENWNRQTGLSKTDDITVHVCWSPLLPHSMLEWTSWVEARREGRTKQTNSGSYPNRGLVSASCGVHAALKEELFLICKTPTPFDLLAIMAEGTTTSHTSIAKLKRQLHSTLQIS